MTKLVTTIGMLGLAILLLSSCSNMPANQKNSLQAPSQQPTEEQAAENMSTELILAENTAAGISLTGITQPESETIAPITLHIGEESKTYQWQNVNNPEYYPQLFVTDLNYDGKNEIYIFLVKGFGANVLDTQLNILSEDYTELTAPNPFVDIKSKLSTTVKEDDSSQIYTLRLNNKKYTYTFEQDAAAMWFEDIVFGKMTTYRIEQNQLIVSLSLQVAPTINVGTLEMSYQYKDNQFKLNTVQLIPIQEQEQEQEQEKK